MALVRSFDLDPRIQVYREASKALNSLHVAYSITEEERQNGVCFEFFDYREPQVVLPEEYPIEYPYLGRFVITTIFSHDCIPGSIVFNTYSSHPDNPNGLFAPKPCDSPYPRSDHYSWILTGLDYPPLIDVRNFYPPKDTEYYNEKIDEAIENNTLIATVLEDGIPIKLGRQSCEALIDAIQLITPDIVCEVTKDY
jgi:hypothetical protein